MKKIKGTYLIIKQMDLLTLFHYAAHELFPILSQLIQSILDLALDQFTNR